MPLINFKGFLFYNGVIYSKICYFMANSYNITGTQGSTLSLNLTVTNSDGTYLNLSGYSISGYCKEKYASTGKLLDLSVSIISAISGLINVSGHATGLAAMPVGIYPYNLEARAGEYVFKPLVGHLLVFPESTNL